MGKGMGFGLILQGCCALRLRNTLIFVTRYVLLFNYFCRIAAVADFARNALFQL